MPARRRLNIGGASSSALMLLSLAHAPGCKTTSLGLKVRTPGSADATAQVRMVMPEGSACAAGLLFGGSTNADGVLSIHHKSCGDVRLIVSRRGHRTVEQRVDTCDVHGLEIVLWPARPPPPPPPPGGPHSGPF